MRPAPSEGSSMFTSTKRIFVSSKTRKLLSNSATKSASFQQSPEANHGCQKNETSQTAPHFSRSKRETADLAHVPGQDDYQPGHLGIRSQVSSGHQCPPGQRHRRNWNR